MLPVHRAAPRRGHSLVELVAVIVAGSTLMGVTIAALVAVQRADRRFTRRASDRQAMGLLADQLRRDVHAAQRVTWDPATNQLTLEAPSGDSVSYQRESSRWERHVSAEANQEPQLAGAFRLPKGAACTIEPAEAEAGTLVRIVWADAAQPHDPWRAAPPQGEVVAAVGRDLALLHQ